MPKALTDEQQARMFEAMRESQKVGAEERRENRFAEMVMNASCGRPRGVPNGEYAGEEPGNDARAEWAEAALQAFCVATGVDTTETAVGDLIADLAHWCDRHNYCDSKGRLNLAELIENGRMHYEAETQGKGGQFDAK
jgi:hypothetical protein